ncbi:MAG: alkaline phosphatase D family protein [Flavobacteriales bacterium]|nr:alkaline phosphatase D family protein [Flavobacteriales bacterium]
MRCLLPLFLLFAFGSHAQDSLQVFWCGAVTDRSVEVRALLNASVNSVRLEVDVDTAFSSPVHSPSVQRDTSGALTILRVKGLAPGTAYHYRFALDGVVDTAAAHIGHFRTTHPGPWSYSFVAGSCNSNSDHPVWEAMRQRDPLFFLSVGDLHYANPNSMDVNVHRQAYLDQVLSRPMAMGLLHQVPIAYVWDDHDYCGDASDASSIGRMSAAQAYREWIPHNPLTHPISTYQSFTIGRIHFILSDLRSSKTAQQMMDLQQRLWLHDQLRYARNHGLVACWVSPLTWNSAGYPENWGAQPAEREALANFIRNEGINDLFILSGDAHMLAIDSGTNTDFSSGTNDPNDHPVFQVAAIAHGGSYKGGTFDQGGYFPNPDIYHGQFGEVFVDDDGTQVCITFKGWRTDSMSVNTNLINSYSFCRTPVDLASIAQGRATDVDPCTLWTTEAVLASLPGAAGEGEVVLCDASGRILSTHATTWYEGLSMVQLGEPPSPGCYFLRLIANDITAVQRLCAP